MQINICIHGVTFRVQVCYIIPFGFYLIKDPEKNKKIALLALPNHEKDI